MVHGVIYSLLRRRSLCFSRLLTPHYNVCSTTHMSRTFQSTHQTLISDCLCRRAVKHSPYVITKAVFQTIFVLEVEPECLGLLHTNKWSDPYLFNSPITQKRCTFFVQILTHLKVCFVLVQVLSLSKCFMKRCVIQLTLLCYSAHLGVLFNTP